MVGILLIAVFIAGVLALFLARYATNPNVLRAAENEREDARPRLGGVRLRALTLELLERLGLTVVEEELRGDARRLIAVRPGPFQGTRYQVFLEPSPPGDVVDQQLVIELADAVRADWGAVGLLITPGEIAKEGLGGLDVKLELIDGTRLRQMVATYLPERLPELDRHHGFGAPARVPPTAAPQPTT